MRRETLRFDWVSVEDGKRERGEVHVVVDGFHAETLEVGREGYAREFLVFLVVRDARLRSKTSELG